MKNTGLAVRLFGLGYLIVAVVGFSSYNIHITGMWAVIFALIPVHATAAQVRIVAQ